MIDLSVIDKYMGFAGIGIDEYSIGYHVEGKVCLVQTGSGRWEVYDLKAGAKVGLQTFATDELACYHIFGVLARRHIAAGTLVPANRN